MRYAHAICAAFLLLASVNGPAQAFGCVPWVYYGPPAYCVSYRYQAVTTYRPEWQTEKVPCFVQKVSYFQETTKVPVTVYVPKVFDEKVKTSVYVATPKVVEQPVTTCVMVPIVSFDPCTGCCYPTWCPQYITQKVKGTVYDYTLETREDVVKVCRMVPEQRVVEHVHWTPKVTQEQSWTLRYTCVMVPCQTTVCVPVYTWGW